MADLTIVELFRIYMHAQMELNLIHALIGRIKCPRYYFLNVPEKRFRWMKGWEGRDRMGRKHDLCECTGKNHF